MGKRIRGRRKDYVYCGKLSHTSKIWRRYGGALVDRQKSKPDQCDIQKKKYDIGIQQAVSRVLSLVGNK